MMVSSCEAYGYYETPNTVELNLERKDLNK